MSHTLLLLTALLKPAIAAAPVRAFDLVVGGRPAAAIVTPDAPLSVVTAAAEL